MTLPSFRNRGGLRLAAFLPLALASCSTWHSIAGDSYNNVKCPSSDVVGELGSISRFRGEGGNFADLAYRGQLTGLKGNCDIDDMGVTVRVTLTVLAEIGPAASDRTVDLPYFVAITGPNDQVIAKQVMQDPLTWATNQHRAGNNDSVTERIPLSNPKDAERYHVLVGFQLTPQEVAYNRTHGTH